MGTPESRLPVVVRPAGRGVASDVADGSGDSDAVPRGLGLGAEVAVAGRLVGRAVGFGVGLGVGLGVAFGVGAGGLGVGAGVVPGFGLCVAFGAARIESGPVPSKCVLASADAPNAAVSASTTASEVSDILASFDIGSASRTMQARPGLVGHP